MVRIRLRRLPAAVLLTLALAVTAFAVFAGLNTATAAAPVFHESPAGVNSAKPLGCVKGYDRATWHRIARQTFDGKWRATRHEKRTLARVFRCQVEPKSRPLLRKHRKRYARSHQHRLWNQGIGKFNRVWSEHSLGAITDSTPWISTTAVRRIMEANDASPAEAYAFSTISMGEAGQYRRGKWRIYPGVTGDDSATVPGATSFGFGILQNTPGVWGWGTPAMDYLRQLGGKCEDFDRLGRAIKALCGKVALRNPLANGRMGYALFQWAGNTFGPWFGTRYLSYNPNARSALTKADRRWLKLGGMLRLRTQ